MFCGFSAFFNPHFAFLPRVHARNGRRAGSLAEEQHFAMAKSLFQWQKERREHKNQIWSFQI
jgi:hypothetical protein